MNTNVTSCDLPSESLLHAATQSPGSYRDCFLADVPAEDTHADAFARFVYLFFDSWLFRLELKILRIAGKAKALNSDPIALANGQSDHFAAWIVDGRTEHELLLRIPETPILTWLSLSQSGAVAQLCFGSGILAQDGKAHPHWGFRATLRPHRMYSASLLRAALADWERGKTLPQ